MRTAFFASVMVVLGSSGVAHALHTQDHYTMTYETCVRRGLPDPFCKELGIANYNVDDYEWSDMGAHAQTAEGKTACASVSASLVRVSTLGQAVRLAIYQRASGLQTSKALASSLGRALHTIQDNCAHHGMPNPQHAWFSLIDKCSSAPDVSPDSVPDALVCAQHETDAIFDTVLSVIHDAGLNPSVLGNGIDGSKKHSTSWGAYCSYLGSADHWDGVDRRWDNTLVQPALRSELVAGLTDRSPDLTDLTVACDSDSGIETRSPAATVNTSGGGKSCLAIHAYCLGKADDGEEVPPEDGVLPPDESQAGCSVNGGGANAVILLLAFAGLRRRRVSR